MLVIDYQYIVYTLSELHMKPILWDDILLTYNMYFYLTFIYYNFFHILWKFISLFKLVLNHDL